MAELKEKGALTFDVNGTEVSLAEEDLLIDIAQTEGYVTEADGAVTVVIDTNLTEELLEEWICQRDRIQDPDHEKGSRLRSNGQDHSLCRGKRQGNRTYECKC